MESVFVTHFVTHNVTQAMPKRLPHTIQRNGIYWLNIRWDSAYIRLTLLTREPDRALALVGLVRDQLQRLRGTSMGINQIKQLVRQWLADQTQLMEQTSATVGLYGKSKLTIGNTAYKAFMNGIGKDKALADRRLNEGLFTGIEQEAHTFASEHIGQPLDGSQFAFLCRELILAKREIARRILEHDYSDRLLPMAPIAPETTASNELLSTVWESYIKELISKGNLLERSETQYRQHFARFLEISGDQPSLRSPRKLRATTRPS
jgi:hypothetical protein